MTDRVSSLDSSLLKGVKCGMPNPDSTNTKAFKSPKDLAKWLKTNHAGKTELFVKIYKKGTGIPSITWNELVIESLCWGWIDGVKKSLDDQAYVQRITPRKPKSNWSKTNTKHVERLISEGRMEASGLVHVEAAKADGRWDTAYKASEMEVPPDFLAALEKKPKLKRFYETLTKANRNAIAHGLENAKRPETRQRRFDNFMDMLEHEERPDYGFKKKS